jgi:hypothetical protein
VNHRLVQAFVWPNAADRDTAGNAQHPAGRGWTEQGRLDPGSLGAA